MTNSISNTKQFLTDQNFFSPSKGLRSIVELLQKEVFTEPELPKLPQINNSEAEKLAIYNDSLFRIAETQNRNSLDPALITVLSEDFTDFDTAKALDYFEKDPRFTSSKSLFNLDSAVQDAKSMQDLESESLSVGAEHSQKVKAAPTKSNYGSRDCVDLASSIAESRFKALREGAVREEQLQKIIEDKSDDDLAKLSATLAQNVSALMPGEALYQPFTIRKDSLAGLQLLETVLDEVKKKFTKASAQLSTIKDFENKTLESLNERKEKLKTFGKKFFPETWCDAIEKSFLLDMRDIFIDACPAEGAEKIWQNLVQNGLHGTIEKTIQETLNEQLAKISGMAKNELEKVSSLVPPEAQSLLGEFGYHLNDPRGWLEISKQSNSNLRVTLYCKASLLDLPGSTPLVFEDVAPDTLDANLFYRLLSYQAWPEWQKAKGFDFKDFNKGFIEQLGKHPSLPRDEDQPVKQLFTEATGAKASQLLSLIAAKSSREPELLLYQMQRQALLDGWPQHKAALLPLAKNHFTRAQKLHAKNLIPAKELRQIEAAYLELSTSREPIKQFFTQFTPAIKDLAVDLLGDEAGKSIDTMSGELGIELKQDSSSEKPSKRLFPELDRFVLHVKQFRPSFYHTFRLLSDAVKIAVHPILGTVLGLAVHAALTLIIPGYTLLGPALYTLISKMAVQYGVEILSIILPPEMSRYLQAVYSLVHEIRNHIFKRIQAAAIKTFIHFAVDPKIVRQLNSQVKRVQETVTKKGELSFALPGHTIEPNSIPLTPVTVFTPLEKPDPVHAEHLQHGPLSVEEIKKWLSPVAHSETWKQAYLLERIATLSIPHPFWDTVDPHEAIDLLHQLTFALHEASHYVIQGPRELIAYYTLYACIDYVARRDPQSHLTDMYKANPSELMRWTSALTSQVPDSNTFRQLEMLARYFAFDLNKRYSDEEINERSKTCLFYYRPQNLSWLDHGKEMALRASWMQELISSHSTSIHNHPNSLDLCYYKEFLSDPEMQIRLESLEPSSSEFEKIVQLFMNPQTPTHTNGILPQSFSLLRLIDTLAHNACYKQRATGILLADIHYHSHKIETFLSIPVGATVMNARGSPSKTNYKDNPALDLVFKINANVAHKNLRSARFITTPGKSTQMAAIIGVRGEAHTKEKQLFEQILTTQERIHIELITGHKSDMIVRTLAFFIQSPEKLREEPFRQLLSACLLNVGALQTQLNTQPSFADHIGRCFQRFLDHPNSFGAYISLVKLALTLNSLHKGLIPGIKERVRRDIEKAADNEQSTKLTAALLTTYEGIDLEAASDEDKKEALIDIYLRKRQHNFWVIYDRWKGLLCRMIDEDKGFRNQLISRIMKRPIGKDEEAVDLLAYLFGAHASSSLVQLLAMATKEMVRQDSKPLESNDRLFFPDVRVSYEKATGHIFYDYEGKQYQLVSSHGLPKEYSSLCCWHHTSQVIATNGVKVCHTLQLDEMKERAVDLQNSPHGLTLLSWIHPLTTLDAFCHVDNPEQISRLSLPLLDLNFRLDESGEMVSVGKFPNYFIRRSQKLASLADIPQYLVLENLKGEMLVLIPKQSEYTTIGIYLAKNLAGLQIPHFLTRSAEQAFETKNGYHAYTLSSSGQLDSQDPAAVANRALHSIAIDDPKACKKWLQKLADLAKIDPLPAEVYDQIHLAMIPLLVIPNKKWMGIGLKLAAISRSNTLLLQHERKSVYSLPLFINERESELLYWTMLQIGFTHYLNQLENGLRAVLDPHEELTLLQEIGAISSDLIQAKFVLKSKLVEKVLDPELMLEHLAMSPQIVHRYHKIKMQLGEQISVREAFNYFLFLGIHSPPNEPKSGTAGVLDTLEKRLQYVTNLVPAWYTFKSVHPIDNEFLSKVARLGLTHLTHNRTKNQAYQFQHVHVQNMLFKPFPTLLADLTTCSTTLRADFIQEFKEHAAAYLCLASGVAPGWLTTDEKALFSTRSTLFRKNLHAVTGDFTQHDLQLLTFFQGIARAAKPINISTLEPYWQGSSDLTAIQAKPNTTLEERKQLEEALYLEFIYKQRAKESLERLSPGYVTPEIQSHFKQKFVRWKEQGVAKMAHDVVLYGSYLYNPISIISYARWAYNLLWAVRKVVGTSNALSRLSSKNPIVDEDSRSALTAVSLNDALKKRESSIDHIFDEILYTFYDISRVEAMPASPRQYKAPHNTPAVAAAFKRLNHSICEYAKRNPESKTVIILKANKTEAELKKALEPLLQQYIAYEKKVTTEIEEFVFEQLNKDKKRHQIKTRLTFHEIENLFIKGQEPAVEIREKLYLYQVTRSRIQPLFRAADLGTLLARRRSYRFDEVQNEKWLRAKLAFESRSGNLLWKKPMEQLKKMLDGSEKKQVLELIMASGKTYYGIPTTDYMLADQNMLLINIWPAAFAPVNTHNTSLQSRLIFDQSASRAQIVRHEGWSLENVRALYNNLQATRRNQGHYNMTQVDAQGLELKFIELLLSNRKDKYRLKTISYLKECVKLIHKQAIALPDEAHEAFNCRKELNYPIGKSKSLDDDLVHLINEVMINLAPLIKRKTWHKVPEKTFAETIMPMLADALVRWPALEIRPEDRTCCAAYISGKLDYIPGFVLESTHKKQIGLLKGMMEQLLPHILSKIIDVDFCNSEIEAEEFAKPSAGNMAPQKRSVIQNPFEAYVKSCMLTLRRRISVEKMEHFLCYLQRTAEAENKKTGIRINSTKSGRLFAKLDLGITLEELSETNSSTTARSMVDSDRATLEYTRIFINPNIRYYPSKLSSNAKNSASMFAGFYGDTGSPYNDGTFPAGTNVVWDEGTLGETIELLQTKCSAQDSVQVLKKETPIEVLDELLEEHLGTHGRAISDRGALFRGLTNIEVAKRILQKTTFKAVVFYNNNEEVVLERGSDAFIALHDCTINPDDRFTYFDQYHTFAANIPQSDTALCIVTFGEDILMAHFAQAIWRMRKLKTASQSIKVVTTAPVAQAMGVLKPTIDDVIVFAVQNEGNTLAEDNFHADKQELHNYVRRMLLDRVLDADTVEESMALMLQHKDFFSISLEDDPFELYGKIERKIPPSDALNIYKNELLSNLSGDDRAFLQEKFDAFPVGIYPELVSISDSDLGLTLEVNEEQEVEQNQRLHQNVAQDQEACSELDTIREPTFWPWPKDLDPINTEWMEANSPAIFSLQQVLKEAESPTLQSIAQLFSPEIYTTNNATPLINRNYIPLYIPPFGTFQKPIFEVLILTENGTRKIIVLDQKEANFWRKKMTAITDPKGLLLSLYDITLNAVVAGGKAAHDEDLLQNDALFQRSIAMLKFLNGDVHYTDRQANALSRWINKCGLELMKKAFLELHEEHKTASFQGSCLDQIFSQNF